MISKDKLAKCGSFISEKFGFLGPGIVVVGSILGGGELINTPIQAANFGFVLLWAVILACVIKYFLQVEIGRYCLIHNCTTIQAFNKCPGPLFRCTSWIAIVYMAIYTVTLLTAVGILGALAGLLHSLFPLTSSSENSARVWGIILILFTQGLLWKSHYLHLEKTVIALVALFSVAVVTGIVLVQGTEYKINGADLNGINILISR